MNESTHAELQSHLRSVRDKFIFRSHEGNNWIGTSMNQPFIHSFVLFIIVLLIVSFFCFCRDTTYGTALWFRAFMHYDAKNTKSRNKYTCVLSHIYYFLISTLKQNTYTMMGTSTHY